MGSPWVEWGEPKGDLKAVSSPSLEAYKWVPEDSGLGSKAELCPLISHRLATSLDSTLQGTYQVTVRAQDRPSVGPALEAKTTLNVSTGPRLHPRCPLPDPRVPGLTPTHALCPQLFTVDQSYRVRLQFSTSKEDVGANTNEIKA